MANTGVPGRLWALRVAELKEICRRAGLRVSGKKSELLERIERAWANDSPKGRLAVRAVLGGERVLDLVE